MKLKRGSGDTPHRHGVLDCVYSHMGAWWGPPAPPFWDPRVPRLTEITAVPPERGIFRPPPRSHLGETHANVAFQCVGSATRCGHQLRVKPKVHEDGLRYNA